MSTHRPHYYSALLKLQSMKDDILVCSFLLSSWICLVFLSSLKGLITNSIPPFKCSKITPQLSQVSSSRCFVLISKCLRFTQITSSLGKLSLSLKLHSQKPRPSMKTCEEMITICQFYTSNLHQAHLLAVFRVLGLWRMEDACLTALFLLMCRVCAGIVEIPFYSRLKSRFVPLDVGYCDLEWLWIKSDRAYRPALSRQKNCQLDTPQWACRVWTSTIPIPSLGFKLNDESLKNSFVLRLGVKITHCCLR